MPERQRDVRCVPFDIGALASADGRIVNHVYDAAGRLSRTELSS